jgi:hypothetical protein
LGAAAGDWLEVAGLPGRPARRGHVLQVLGRPGHEHYRVQWDEEHESLFFPTDGAHVVRRARDDSAGRPQPTPTP